MRTEDSMGKTAPVHSLNLEQFLATIYVDPAARARFLASPEAEASRAGLSEQQCLKLKEIDFTGLEMASRSFAQTCLQAGSVSLLGVWLVAQDTYKPFTAKVVCSDISSPCDESRERQRPAALRAFIQPPSSWLTCGVLKDCIMTITGQSLPIFIQVVWSFLISARILMRRMESLRRRLRPLPFGRERRNISMTC